MTRKKTPAIYGALALAIILLSLLSMSIGKVWIPLSDWSAAPDSAAHAILFELRLPRTLLAIMIGVALGASGAALQGYTRNPLADPGMLGVSTMAALGAVMTFYMGSLAASIWVMPLAAMMGAAIGVVLLLMLAGTASSIITFVLAGVVIQTIASAGVSLALNLAPNPWAVNEIVTWLMGSISDRSMNEVKIALPGIAIGCILLFTQDRTLDALTLGEDGARSLGIQLNRSRILLVLGAALAVGSAVAVSGAIGFVGLIVPHVVRMLIGSRPSSLLIPSALGGAVLMLAADILVRLPSVTNEIKLGVALSIVGGPFFLALLVSMRRKLA